ncbi:tetratricopeptide repeat protein [Salinarimonas chemoclinalis]|uniref:tetratricopeptide repeat protein n=1 Tax=Salinarimonas chemoclinalis TaxID=3241599 RepID=UPI003558DFFB
MTRARRQRERPAGRAHRVLALALALSLAAPIDGRGLVPADAQEAPAGETTQARVRAAQEPTWGRIRLDFDTAVTVAARADNGVLVIRFDRPVEIVTERVAEEIPSYVNQVRRDPDGTGLRMALSQNFSASVLPAGETVFVDLLPEAWRGMPPGLPEDVVADLARRAAAAEERFAAERAARRDAMPAPMPVRVAELPGLTRLIFAAPEGVPVEARSNERSTTLFFDGRLALEPERLLPTIPGIADVSEDDTGEALYVRIDLAEGYTSRGFREEDGFVLDIEPVDPAAGGVAPVRAALGLVPFLPGQDEGAAPPDAVPAPEDAPPTDDPPVVAQPRAAAPIAEPVPDTTPAPETAPAPTIAEAPAAAPAPIDAVRDVPVVGVDADGLRIAFPVAATVPAAAFTRAGVVTVVFQSPATLPEPDLSGVAADFARLESLAREGPFVTTRLRLTEPRVARLTPEEGGWTLTIGTPAQAAPEPIGVRAVLEDSGRTGLALDLLDATGVHWIGLAGGGERIAVVTAPGPARNVPSTRRFTELELLPTAHGVAVAAIADDVVVRADLDGVHVGRGAGLSIALPDTDEGGATDAPLDLVLDHDDWVEAQRGSAQADQRARLARIVDAPVPERSRERLALARALLAHGLAPEAWGTHRFALAEDPDLASDAKVRLLEGILAAMNRRFDAAEALLTQDEVIDLPEAVLWRAYVDAKRGPAPRAIAGFGRAERVLDAYPDDLQGLLRLAAVRAGLAERDFGFADEQLTRIARLHPGAVPTDEVDLVRALVDTQTGRVEFALAELTRLAESASRPVAAEAELARVRLALAEGAMEASEAIEALEHLSIAWRGDEIEVETNGLLGRLYADAQRWRDAFFTAHMANLIYPDHPVTLQLHEETAQAFDDLFLSGRGADLDEVEAVALFFDFKEFLPIGRRGDEIVRRLADRLVSLGLLDKAAELLTHQVDNRLEGAGRAAVAARLATIRLIDGQPAEALSTIERTRIAELPQAVRRVRNLIEARALSDLSRTDLALEVIEDESGPEIDRLRADVWWTGRRWREAGEAHEALAGTSWREERELGDRERIDVMRAALAYNLGQDAIGLDRLKAKFADAMNDSADAPGFAVLSDPAAIATPAFREAARTISNQDTLADFLAALQARHPGAALPVGPMAEAGAPADPPAAAPDGAAEAPPATEPTPVPVPGPEARATDGQQAL